MPAFHHTFRKEEDKTKYTIALNLISIYTTDESAGTASAKGDCWTKMDPDPPLLPV
jgi:hypothetical protein